MEVWLSPIGGFNGAQELNVGRRRQGNAGQRLQRIRTLTRERLDPLTLRSAGRRDIKLGLAFRISDDKHGIA